MIESKKGQQMRQVASAWYSGCLTLLVHLKIEQVSVGLWWTVHGLRKKSQHPLKSERPAPSSFQTVCSFFPVTFELLLWNCSIYMYRQQYTDYPCYILRKGVMLKTVAYFITSATPELIFKSLSSSSQLRQFGADQLLTRQN